MACQSEVMHYYEQIAPITERMLALARSGEWGLLPELELQQSGMVEHLQRIEPLEDLDTAQVARKYSLLSRITAQQAEITQLVMPQLQHLGQVLRNMASQQLLHHTYGQSS